MTGNWDAARGRAAANYPIGVNANTNWHSQAVAGQNSYVQSMMDPNVLNRRLTGLQTKTRQEDWTSRASTLGSQRIAQGMAAGKPAYDAAATIIHSTLAGLTLAPRTTDMDQNVDNRVKPIGHALKSAFGKE